MSSGNTSEKKEPTPPGAGGGVGRGTSGLQRWNSGLGKSGGCGRGAGGGRARLHATSQHATAAATATRASSAVRASATASPAADTQTCNLYFVSERAMSR